MGHARHPNGHPARFRIQRNRVTISQAGNSARRSTIASGTVARRSVLRLTRRLRQHLGKQRRTTRLLAQLASSAQGIQKTIVRTLATASGTRTGGPGDSVCLRQWRPIQKLPSRRWHHPLLPAVARTRSSAPRHLTCAFTISPGRRAARLRCRRTYTTLITSTACAVTTASTTGWTWTSCTILLPPAVGTHGYMITWFA